MVGQERDADDRPGELERVPDLVQDDDVVERQERNGEERRVGVGAAPVDGQLARSLGDTEDLLVLAAHAESAEQFGGVGGTGAWASGDYEALHRILTR